MRLERHLHAMVGGERGGVSSSRGWPSPPIASRARRGTRAATAWSPSSGCARLGVARAAREGDDHGHVELFGQPHRPPEDLVVGARPGGVGVQRVAVARQGADGQPGVGDPLPVGLASLRQASSGRGRCDRVPASRRCPARGRSRAAAAATASSISGKASFPNTGVNTPSFMSASASWQRRCNRTRKGCNRFQRDLIPRRFRRARDPRRPREGRTRDGTGDQGPGRTLARRRGVARRRARGVERYRRLACRKG